MGRAIARPARFAAGLRAALPTGESKTAWCAVSGMSHHMLLMLGQVIGDDGEPGRLGADEYEVCRTDSWVFNESSHGDMDKGALADDQIEERPANPAMRVVAVFVAEDHELVFVRGEGELIALYPGEGLEGRAGRPPAVGAVTIRSVRASTKVAEALRGLGWKYRSQTGCKARSVFERCGRSEPWPQAEPAGGSSGATEAQGRARKFGTGSSAFAAGQVKRQVRPEGA
jgi:hypothetical protein